MQQLHARLSAWGDMIAVTERLVDGLWCAEVSRSQGGTKEPDIVLLIDL